MQPALKDEPRRSIGVWGPSLAEKLPKNVPEISGQTAFRYPDYYYYYHNHHQYYCFDRDWLSRKDHLQPLDKPPSGLGVKSGRHAKMVLPTPIQSYGGSTNLTERPSNWSTGLKIGTNRAGPEGGPKSASSGPTPPLPGPGRKSKHDEYGRTGKTTIGNMPGSSGVVRGAPRIA